MTDKEQMIEAVDLRRAFEGEETMTTETPPAWSLAMARSEMGFDIAAGSLAIDPIAAEGLPENDNAEVEARRWAEDMEMEYRD
jgi:hypothetical protein